MASWNLRGGGALPSTEAVSPSTGCRAVASSTGISDIRIRPGENGDLDLDDLPDQRKSRPRHARNPSRQCGNAGASARSLRSTE